jgi:dynein heavy chain
MVWVDPKNLGYRPFFQRWLVMNVKDNPERVTRLEELFSKYVPELVDWMMLGLIFGEYESKPRMVLPLTNLNLVMSMCHLLGSCFQQAPETEVKYVEGIFVACITWSFGAALIQSEQKRFDFNLKKLSGMTGSDNAQVQGTSLPGQTKFTIFDYKYHLKNQNWVQWSTEVQEFVPQPGTPFYQILVPTADTVRSTWLVETCVEVFRPSIFVGDPGTSKTATLQHYLKSLDTDKFNLLNIGFSSRTSGKDLQINVESNVEKRLKGTYGPPGGKKLIIFIDDINMPIVDTYGTQQPVTLLKLFIERGGLYDREDLQWKNIVGTHCLAACGPPGGARNPMDPRFVSLFNIFNIPFPSDESLNRIFSTILDAHFAAFTGLPKDGDFFKSCGKIFSECTLKLYQALVQAMPPTPTRFHYVFNLRDLSRVAEGLCTSTPDMMATPVAICRLWRNEALRVFHDRLISQEDKDWFIKAAGEQLKKSFAAQADAALEGPVLFGDTRHALAVMEGGSEARLNEDLGGYLDAKVIFDGILEAYNEKEKAMDLVLFDDAIDHLCRLHRLLRLPRGNALLVGVGGSGKQSLTRLAAFAAECVIFQITITRSYGIPEFREDLKAMYSMLKKQKVVFLFTDQHVADEGFLELINNLLTMGMVPALFPEDERQGLINSVAKEVKEKGLPDSKDAMWSYYIEQCRDHLHIVLAMSPVGDDLRRRCRNFPGMVNNTVIDWFQPWPADALQSVADKFLAEVDLPDNLRPAVTQHMMAVHQSVLDASVDFQVQLRRYNYVTPKNYLTFIATYKKELSANRNRNQELVERLDGGLKKLIQAAKDVAVMQAELAEKTVIVDQKTKDCNEMLETISVNTKEATEKQEAAAKTEEELGVKSVEIAEQKAIAEEKLGAAMPALEEAAAALNDLSKDDVTEIKNFAKPHVLVQGVAECVGILKKQKDTSWAGAKTMMSQGNFLQSLMTFDKDGITEGQIKQIKKYMADSQFTPTGLLKISKAGAGIHVDLTTFWRYV